MTRTMWFALFCLVGLGAAVAIKAAAPPVALVVEAAQDQSKTEPEPAPNELAKSDRLELPNTRLETENIVPPAKTMPTETPSAGTETIKKVADRHWQDANAGIVSVASPRRHTKSKESKKSAATSPPNAAGTSPSNAAGTSPSNARAEVWHCRQDAMGSLLRSLDLSPRCDL
jgi:hypothetical protein